MGYLMLAWTRDSTLSPEAMKLSLSPFVWALILKKIIVNITIDTLTKSASSILMPRRLSTYRIG